MHTTRSHSLLVCNAPRTVGLYGPPPGEGRKSSAAEAKPAPKESEKQSAQKESPKKAVSKADEAAQAITMERSLSATSSQAQMGERKTSALDVAKGALYSGMQAGAVWFVSMFAGRPTQSGSSVFHRLV